MELYLAVVHPVVYLKSKHLRYRVECCAVVWLMVLGSCLFCMLLILTSIYNYYFLVHGPHPEVCEIILLPLSSQGSETSLAG